MNGYHMLDLEKINTTTKTSSKDTNLLAKAKDYNINLDDLESIEIITNNYDIQEELEDKFSWDDIDVSLKDIISRVFEKSLRPIVIIQNENIVYLNPMAKKVLEITNARDAINNKFLYFIDKNDRVRLAENVAEMVISGNNISVNLQSEKGKIIPTTLNAIYLPDNDHFSFILMADSISETAPHKTNQQFNLYDELTGLPSFYLLEDRLQFAVNKEYNKDPRFPKKKIALIAINIDNIDFFNKLNIKDYAIKKLASKLLLSINKDYTVARGLHYPFWILLTDIDNSSLNMEIEKIKKIFKEGVGDNSNTHELTFSIGASLFPNPAKSAKRLSQQVVSAVKEAQQTKNNSIVYYKEI